MALNDLVVLLSRKQLPLLPTPRASEGTKGSANQHGSKGDLTLTSTVLKLSDHHSSGDLLHPQSDDGKQ